MVQRVGIDLGTTYSAVSVVENGKPVIVRNSYDKELTPSIINFFNDDVLVGDEAYDMMASGTGESVTAFKRMMGVPGTVATYNGKDYTAEELSSILLKHLVDEASKKLGERITEAVITVPQYFDDIGRVSTINAGKSFGLNVLKIINEPTAAALYYGYSYFKHKTLMVYDLGGGTFDVNVISFDNGKTDVLGSKGNHILGGKNWDEVLMNMACDKFMEEFDVDPRKDAKCKSIMMANAERVKRQLSTSSSAPFLIEYEGWTGRYVLTRDDFVRNTRHLMDTTKTICDDVLADIGMDWDEIDEILLIGGSCRMPMVHTYLEENTGRPVVHHPDMELAVAKGAAIAAKSYNQGISESILSDVTAHSLGALAVEQDRDRYINQIMIPKNSKIPCEFTKRFRIEKNSWTDMIEVYALQGESKDPSDCVIVSRSEITGFDNAGEGVDIDITYHYDENGVIMITANQGGEPLEVTNTSLPSDIAWISGKPSERKNDKEAVKKSIAVCVDVSRSMGFKDANDRIPLDEAKKSIKSFVDGFEGEDNRFSLMIFSDKNKVLCEPTSDRRAFKDAVDGINLKATGSGTTSSPIELANATARTDGYMSIIVILTDGIWKHMDRSVKQSRACKDEGVPIFALGFGDANISFLKQIANVDNGGLYTTIENLGNSFDTIATAIKSNSMGLRTKE